MMNSRLIELIQNPSMLKMEDLDLLQQEIQTKPYMQSFRALYLLGVHQFQTEKYPQALSETAAYTTDKKILYLLINGQFDATTIEEIIEENAEEVVSDASDENSIVEVETGEINIQKSEESTDTLTKVEGKTAEFSVNIENEDTSNEIEVPTENSVEKNAAEQNTIEEVLASEEAEVENELEVAAEQKAISEESNIAEQAYETEKLTDEEPKVGQENQELTSSNGSDAEEVLPSSTAAEINFHESADFLPKVHFTASKTDQEFSPQAKKPSKHDLEMQRLIEEVERKMKAKKAESKPAETPIVVDEEKEHRSEISFADTQAFVVKPEEATTETQEIENTTEVASAEELVEISNPILATTPNKAEPKTAWKPMSISGNKPDSLITKNEDSKGSEIKANVQLSSGEEKSESAAKDPSLDSKKEELPVMNVSFFSEKIEIIKEETPEITLDEKPESNVPQFYNTWQNWLKIDRSEPESESKKPEPELPKEIKKTAVIEKFIETEPKISQLKEENNYVVKEKKKDISHLMTETLANIYVEQKLYSKAIKAFNTLIAKHPEKEDYFKEKIKNVEELRG